MATTRTAQICMFAVLLAGLAGACGGKAKGGAAAESPGDGDPVGDVLRLVEQWRQGYEVRSLEAISTLYSHDDDVVRIQQGRPVQGWREVENQLHGELGRSTSIYVRLKDIQVARLAPGAVAVTAGMAREASDGVTTVAETGVLSLVLRRDGDAWLIVSEHYSFAPQS